MLRCVGALRGEAAEVTDDIEAVTGRPATPFAQLAADHAAAFRGA